MGVTRRDHRSLDQLSVAADEAVIHSVQLSNGTKLHFYAETAPGPELYVAFHGALRPGYDIYPRFERVASLKKRTSTFISLADPTLHLDATMNLAWYAGGPGWDPQNDILKVIEHVQRITGAERIVFIGGSGGGFAALRASVRVPGSLAYVQSPQTILSRYQPDVLEHYLRSAWGRLRAEVLPYHMHRFDLLSLYRSLPSTNFIYYLQNMNDPNHIRSHYRDFKRGLGVADAAGKDPSGMKLFVLSDSELTKHGPPTPAEFEYHFDAALSFYRAEAPRKGL